MIPEITENTSWIFYIFGYNMLMWKPKPYDKDYQGIFLKQGKSKLIARLLAQRSVPPSRSDEFLSADYKSLSHPHKLHGIKEGVDLFVQTIKAKGKISIISDYDADGIISAVMLKEACSVFKADCKAFFPSRLEHGYGLNEKTIKSYMEFIKEPSDLLIIADCGSNNEAEIQALKRFGTKHIVIIDHHPIDPLKQSVSADVMVSWHLSKEYQEACACGEVFQFIRGIRCRTSHINPMEFLSYAGIGTLGDVSPLNADNRILVKNGLKTYSLNHVTGSGLAALIRKAYAHGRILTQEDISFKIVPRINAVGRMLRPDIAFNLLVEKDPSMAERMVEELNDCNNERKEVQKVIETEIIKTVNKDKDRYPHGIAVYDPGWHTGIVGIVASKIVETFKKPAIVVGRHNNLIKGSGRSPKNIDLKEILKHCEHIFVKHGGHKQACGVELKPECVEDFNDIFNEACKKYYDASGASLDLNHYYDAELRIDSICPETARELFKSLYPYCYASNPEPVFKISDIMISETELKEDTTWRMLTFYMLKDGKKTESRMKMFTSNYGTEINGLKADVYFTFSQNLDNTDLNVVDIVFKK